MSYEFYKTAHIFSWTTLITAAFMLAFCRLPGFQPLKKWVLSLHGISTLTVLISGFGLIAKLKLSFQMTQNYAAPLSFFLSVLLAWFLIFLLHKKDKAKMPFYAVKVFPGFFFIALALFLSPKLIQPQWLESKILVWLFFAFCPVLLPQLHNIGARLKRPPSHTLLLYTAFILAVSFKAVYSAVFKF